MKRMLVICALAPLTLLAGRAHADDDPQVCAEPHEIDKYQLLRRLSLDLRGQVPSIEEYAALDGADGIEAATLQQYLESDEFRASMRRYHEEMFWPNVSYVQIKKQPVTLSDRAGSPALILDNNRAKKYRGSQTALCDDHEQTDFDPAFPGEFRPIDVPTDADGVKHEGWRLVTPYWDPSTPVKVCAFDAQETVATSGKDTVPCNSAAGQSALECGCGPSARFCYFGKGDGIILQALREQIGLAVDDVATGTKPYTDLLLSTKAYENGKIAFWKKYLASNLAYGATYNAPDPDEEIADKPWTDDSWTEVDRKGLHAGVLTLPAYLLRFQTQRGRANRFRIDFACQYFVPPEKIETEGCDANATDLTQRCTCRYCHSELEPKAAHFGLFTESGTTLLTDTSLFPLQQSDCVGAKSQFCGKFYVTDSNEERAGWLLPYQWAGKHPEYVANLDGGPAKLAKEIIADGTFAECAVKRVFSHFVKRDMRTQGDATDEYELLEQLAGQFQTSGYSFPALVQNVVSLAQYRRAR